MSEEGTVFRDPVILFILAFLGAGCAAHPAQPAPTPPRPAKVSIEPGHRSVIPPVMRMRQIAPDHAVTGESIEIKEGGLSFLLYLPPGWVEITKSNWSVAIHFHGVPWFIIQEHNRRGALHPLLCVNLGEGSSIYQNAFRPCERLPRLLERVTGELTLRGAHGMWSGLELSSFSAGYGAVRELLQCPEVFAQITCVVLADSMYASVRTNSVGQRQVAPEHLAPWLGLARGAMAGDKTFLFSYSAVPTEAFASSSECAGALLQKLNLHAAVVDRSLGAQTSRSKPPRTSAGCMCGAMREPMPPPT